ncbi:hypothetical protein KPY62_01630 [Psychrobacter sp. TAE2020]|nr:hypothetical protein [Psychrobacter sp. TAE2020]MBU5615822.1 hypothetical protein [Psychrobacter sp. TAE2020]
MPSPPMASFCAVSVVVVVLVAIPKSMSLPSMYVLPPAWVAVNWVPCQKQ